jgi:hypothetical protein
MTSNELWEEVERVEDILGKEEFLYSLEKAMGDDMLEDLTAYICRMNDIDTKCEEK